MTCTVDIQSSRVCETEVAMHTCTNAHVSLEQASRFLLSLDGQKAAIQRLSAYPAGKGISLSASLIYHSCYNINAREEASVLSP